MLVGSHGRILDAEEVRDFPCSCWECYEAWDESWWDAVYYEVPDEAFYWDNIAWPDKYVTDLSSRCWNVAGRGQLWGEPIEPRGVRFGFHLGEVPKHLRYKPYEAYKHWRGESRRRQRVKKAKKHSFRTRTRAALKGNCNGLRNFFPASNWDID